MKQQKNNYNNDVNHQKQKTNESTVSWLVFPFNIYFTHYKYFS